MNTVLEILTLSFAPGVFGLSYFFYGARYGPDKSRPLVLCFLAGTVAGPLALLLFEAIEHIPVYGAAMRFLDSDNESIILALSLFVIGPVEELSKFVLLWALLYGRKEFNHPVDGLTFSAAVGLGFASIENWYAMAEMGSTDWARAITLPFLHGLFSSFWGVGLSLAKFGKTVRFRNIIFLSLPLSFIYHGLFDYIVLSPRVSPLFVLPLVLLLWFWLSQCLRHLQSTNSKQFFAPRLN